MKAASILCPETGITGVSGGRVQTHRHRKDIENEEIQMYLSKLKDLVPFMPKDRKLSKLEVIQYVIDYICDLQNALETHPAVSAFDAAAALGQKKSAPAANLRQPLGVRPSPNTILTTVSTTTPSDAPVVHSSTTTPEKLSPSDGRPVSC